MSGHFINLNCTDCGAKLSVYDDMVRFSCGHGGTKLIADRRGGTVALMAIAEAIKKVQIGTDKTAAELAITRYESELKDLRENEAKLSKAGPADSCTGIGCGGIPLLVGLLVVADNSGYDAGLVLVLVCVAGAIVVFVRHRDNRAELQGIRARIRRLEAQVAEKKQIADS